MKFEDFLGQFSGYGITGTILVALAYISRFVAKSKWFEKIIDKVVDNLFTKKDKKSTNETVAESNIVNHEIFSYIDFWVSNKIPSMVFANDFRTAVFRKYLSVYLLKYKNNLKEFVTDKKYQTMSENELFGALIGLVNKTIYEYEMELTEIGVPHIVISRMKIKCNEFTALSIDLMEGICTNDFFNSDKNLLKVSAVLNTLYPVFNNLILNSIPTCNSINGAMQGMTFQGYMEPYHD